MMTLEEAQAIALECQGRLQGAFFRRMLPKKEKTWVIEWDHPDRVERLFICLQRVRARFHLTKEGAAKGSTPWTQVVNKRLEGCSLQACHLLGQDRILELVFEKGEGRLFLIFELFSERAYLTDEERRLIAAFPKRLEGVYAPPSAPTERGEVAKVSCTSEEIEARYAKQEEQEEFSHLKERAMCALKKKIQRVEGQKGHAQEMLQEAEKWGEVEHQAQLLKANFPSLKRGMTCIELEEWEGGRVTIPLDPKFSAVEQVDRFFKRARKLKKGVPHAKRQIAEREKECAELHTALEKLNASTSLVELQEVIERYDLIPPPTPKKEHAVPKKRLPYRVFKTEAGLEIWAAKSDRDGDTLTLTLAHGLDWWLHVSSYPGSHVVLKPSKGEEPDPESIRDAAVIALYFSKAKQAGSGEVTVTQVKHVSKPKGAKPGLVTVARSKKLFAHLDPIRLSRLQGSAIH